MSSIFFHPRSINTLHKHVQLPLKSVQLSVIALHKQVHLFSLLNTTALRNAKIVYNYGLFECSRVKQVHLSWILRWISKWTCCIKRFTCSSVLHCIKSVLAISITLHKQVYLPSYYIAYLSLILHCIKCVFAISITLHKQVYLSSVLHCINKCSYHQYYFA